ncbi:bactofilin family protein [Minwuia sp.]|uniref:bactofilin family protein n=1 Tax=Minwuia sp. TaxID=2493630 RepID=UPI003A940D8E
MFNKKQGGQQGSNDTPETEGEDKVRTPRTSTPRPAEDLLARRPRADIPRTPIPSVPSDSRGPARREDDSKLLVGDGITLKGEVTNCAELIVEGKVDAKVEATRFQVSNSGRFSGECNVDEADIAGQFDGILNCRGKLVVRGTGKLKGTLRYGDVEIEAGGRIAGEIQVFGEDEAEQTGSVASLKAAGE